MKKTVKYIVLIFLCSLAASDIDAQRNIVVGGGEMISSSGSASYSLGQLFYEAGHSSSVSLLQGVQQPFEWQVLNTQDITEDPGVNIQFFPNPTTDLIFLEIDESSPMVSYELRLFNSTGQLIKNQSIVEVKTLISLGNMPSGIYFLHLLEKNNNTLFRTIKIIKN